MRSNTTSNEPIAPDAFSAAGSDPVGSEPRAGEPRAGEPRAAEHAVAEPASPVPDVSAPQASRPTATASASEGFASFSDSLSSPASLAPSAIAPPSSPSEGRDDSAPTGLQHVEAWRELWPAVVDLVRSRNALLGAVIEDARPLKVADGELTIAFSTSASFNKKKAEDRDNKVAVAQAVKQLTGTSFSLKYSLLDADPALEGEPLSEEEMLRVLIAEFDAQELPDGWAKEGSEQIESE